MGEKTGHNVNVLWNSPLENVFCRTGRIIGFLPLLCLFCLLWLPPQTRAYEDSHPDDYITRHFDVKVRFDDSHTAKVTEHIEVFFVQAHQGIIRKMPLAMDRSYKIKHVKVPGYQFTTRKDGEQLLVEIGEPDVELTGKHVYEINYEIVYYKDRSFEQDELDQILLPDNWGTSIRHSRLVVVMPKACNWDQTEIDFGRSGSMDEDWSKYFKKQTTERVLTFDGKDIPLHYGLVVWNAHLPEGYWENARSSRQGDAARNALLLFIILVSAVIPVLLWLKWGRDYPVTETEEYEPPQGLTPAEAGYALDGVIDDREMMTMLLYFAQKGYLKIIEVGSANYDLQKADPIHEKEPAFAKRLYAGLYRGGASRVPVKALPRSFRKDLDKAKAMLESSFEAMHGSVFTIASQVARFACMGIMMANELLCGLVMGNERIFSVVPSVILQLLGIAMVFSGYWKMDGPRKKRWISGGVLVYLFGLLIVVYLVARISLIHGILEGLCGLLIPFFGWIMPRRDQASARLLGRLRGYRSCIRKADASRLRALTEENPDYFYETLPYAIIFDMETQWSSHFTDIPLQEPAWYQSYRDVPFVYSREWSQQLLTDCLYSERI